MGWDLNAAEEFLLVEARFRALVGEWCLGRSQVAKLIAVDPESLGFDLIPKQWSRESEHRMRILVEIRDILPALFTSTREIQWWLHGSFQEDEELTPLDYMSAGTENLRALRYAIVVHVEQR